MTKFQDILDHLRPDLYISPKFSVLYLSMFKEQQQSDQFKVLAVSNGLILCRMLDPWIYYVCDLVTRQWVIFPGVDANITANIMQVIHQQSW